MSKSFFIDIKNWHSTDYGSAIQRLTLADLNIRVNDFSAMEVEEIKAQTVSPSARVSAYALAYWLASNWWRLRWEPERDSLTWKMSHKVGAVGEGFLWPDLCFSSDGETIFVHSKSVPFFPAGQPIRYLNSFDVLVSADEFESGIDDFLERVIERLIAVQAEGADLIGLWKEVLEERRNPSLASRRKLEAIMGFDPDEAPEDLIVSLEHAEKDYGVGAVEEVAAASMRNALADINELWGTPRAESSRLCVPEIETLRQSIRDAIQSSLFPWQRATKAAHIARQVWSIGSGPIATQMLSDIFCFPQNLIDDPSGTRGPMPAGYRNGTADSFNVFLNSPYPTNRRFALMRLVGDHLTAPLNDKLLPAPPSTKTQRQKFQRAFAQEFLCPYAELASYLKTEEPSDDAIEDAALYFDVSAQLVKTTLVNKGQLERSSLAT